LHNYAFRSFLRFPEIFDVIGGHFSHRRRMLGAKLIRAEILKGGRLGRDRRRWRRDRLGRFRIVSVKNHLPQRLRCGFFDRTRRHFAGNADRLQ
jgi:hypothetical protein